MTSDLEVVADGLVFGEGPRWRAGALWLSDMHDKKVLKVAPSGEVETVLVVDKQPSGLGWLPDGDLLVVSMLDRKVLRRKESGELTTHADLSKLAPRRINDMVVDAKGRAYVGNFGFDFDRGEAVAPTVLVMVTPEGEARVAAEDLYFPNGMVIAPDGRTLIVGETWGGRLTAFDIAEDGTLSNRRVWAQLPREAVPDGCCLDADGAVWVASPTTNEVLRMREGGEVAASIPTGRGAFACMLGGADRRSLYVCTADSSHPGELEGRRTGRVETVRVAVPGAGLP